MPITDKLSAIGGAIRTVSGKTELLTLEQMPGEILELSSGGGLGFEIVCRGTRPNNPSQNTIWVNTDVDVTDLRICADTPRFELNNAVYGITSEANITLYTVEGRNHIKVNGGEAIYTFAKSANGYWALMLVSPNADAVTTKNSYKSSETRPYQGAVAYEGVTYYWGRCDYGSSGTHDVTPKYTGSDTPEALALIMAKEYHALKESAAGNEQYDEGTMWITIGNAGSVDIVSTVGDNWITVYPLSAKQYISGSWVAKETKSYQNGTWVDWWNGELYMEGARFTGNTGNWISLGKAMGSDSYAGIAPDIQENADNFKIYYASSVNASGMYYLENKIDLTKYTTLHFEGELIPYDGVENRARVQIWSDIGQYTLTNVVAYLAKSGLNNGAGAIDVSALNGEYYIGFSVYSRSSNVSTITCKKLYLT